MTDNVKKWIAHRKREEAKEGRDKKTPADRAAYRTLRAEARAHGAVLANGGRGGLPASFVLKIMRRDGYVCKVHGDKGEGKNGGLTLHHKGGVVESEWLNKKGHKSELNNLVVLCTRAHNAIHEKAREEGTDSSQVEPEGDKGREGHHGPKKASEGRPGGKEGYDRD